MQEGGLHAFANNMHLNVSHEAGSLPSLTMRTLYSASHASQIRQGRDRGWHRKERSGARWPNVRTVRARETMESCRQS
jgi:hypothetical protein